MIEKYDASYVKEHVHVLYCYRNYDNIYDSKTFI